MQKKVYIIISSLIATSLGISVCVFIAEQFFFDKFYYKKSISHGYYINNISTEDFGKRAEDIIPFKNNNSQVNNPLGVKDKNIYTIAIISDSYGWGMGLRNHNRFSEILEKKLNRIHPTKIISLSLSGDSILDHYIKYKLLEKFNINHDLLIFGLVENDLIFERFNKYDKQLSQQIIEESNCNNEKVYFNDLDIDYSINYQSSFNKENSNDCIFNYLIQKIPPNSLYFDYGNFFNGNKDNEFYTQIINPLKDSGFYVVSPQEDLEKYNSSELFVSEKETHPSKLSNTIFAQYLYNEITNNPLWNFPTPNQ